VSKDIWAIELFQKFLYPVAEDVDNFWKSPQIYTKKVILFELYNGTQTIDLLNV